MNAELSRQFDSLNVPEMTDEQCRSLCEELRTALVESVCKTGGHLASNLGNAELIVSIHRVYDTTRDRLVFDVGHQCYCHKMLTGRAGMMDTLRMLDGLSGFPKPSESVHDAFIAGHASNSVSVALGMARARTLLHEDYQVISIIGDGALTGGLAYEGLADAGQSKENMVVVLVDNGMSIKKNVGGVAKLLSKHHIKSSYLTFKERYHAFTSNVPGGQAIYRGLHKIKQTIKGSLLPSSFFEDMGFIYTGPVNGHDLSDLTRLLSWAKKQRGPVLLHVRTIKGKGYGPAEAAPAKYHGVSPFDPKTGLALKPSGTDFSAVFGQELIALAEQDPRICAVTAAMQSGTGLDAFASRFPTRSFDVGIAEGHAVSMCAGMAKQGMIPVFAIYSTFLQRSYDMLIHDVAIQNLHVVFCVDRAGLVGSDGETHQGVFDVGFLSTVPNMTILAPSSFNELRSMLRYAIHEVNGPIAVRYPRGGENGYTRNSAKMPGEVLRSGTNFTIVSYGTLIGEALAAAELLEKETISVEVVKMNRIWPLAPELAVESIEKTKHLLVLEEVNEQNSLGINLMAELCRRGVMPQKVLLRNTGRSFVRHGSVPQLWKLLGLDREHIAAEILEELK